MLFWRKLRKHFKHCRFMCVHGRSCAFMGVHGCSWVFMGVHGCSWVFRGVHGYSWVFMGVHGCSCVFRCFFGDFYFFVKYVDFFWAIQPKFDSEVSQGYPTQNSSLNQNRQGYPTQVSILFFCGVIQPKFQNLKVDRTTQPKFNFYFFWAIQPGPWPQFDRRQGHPTQTSIFNPFSFQGWSQF